MEQSQLSWITGYIWGIADDVQRDVYVRGKYRDVILPITVLRRLDAVLESTKQAVLDMKASLDKAGVVHQDQALRQAAGHLDFYASAYYTACADACRPDDQRHLALRVRESVRVLIVDGEQKTKRQDDESFYLELAMQPEKHAYLARRFGHYSG